MCRLRRYTVKEVPWTGILGLNQLPMGGGQCGTVEDAIKPLGVALGKSTCVDDLEVLCCSQERASWLTDQCLHQSLKMAYSKHGLQWETHSWLTFRRRRAQKSCAELRTPGRTEMRTHCGSGTSQDSWPRRPCLFFLLRKCDLMPLLVEVLQISNPTRGTVSHQVS